MSNLLSISKMIVEELSFDDKPNPINESIVSSLNNHYVMVQQGFRQMILENYNSNQQITSPIAIFESNGYVNIVVLGLVAAPKFNGKYVLNSIDDKSLFYNLKTVKMSNEIRSLSLGSLGFIDVVTTELKVSYSSINCRFNQNVSSEIPSLIHLVSNDICNQLSLNLDFNYTKDYQIFYKKWMESVASQTENFLKVKHAA
jgi:hypothetical protein